MLTKNRLYELLTLPRTSLHQADTWDQGIHFNLFIWFWMVSIKGLFLFPSYFLLLGSPKGVPQRKAGMTRAMFFLFTSDCPWPGM